MSVVVSDRCPLPTKEFLPEFAESFFLQWLGQDVCKLFVRADFLDLDGPIFYFVSKVVILDVDVPRAGSQLWRLGELESALIVFKRRALDL